MLRIRSIALPALLVLGALTSGCSSEEPIGGNIDPRVLYGFEGCEDLLDYTKTHAKQLIDEYGNLHGEDYGNGWWGVDDGAGEGSGGFDSAGGEDGGDAPSGEGDPSGGGDEGVDYSGTNVQEAGVDEPDLVKTDGERVLAFARGKLHFVDASGASPTLRGSLEIGQDVWDAQMFMHEDRALLLVRTYAYDYSQYEEWGEPLPPGAQQGPDFQEHFGDNYHGGITRLVEVDISNPDALKIVANLYITGDMVSARMVEGVSRVVVRSGVSGLAIKDPWEFFDDAAFEAELQQSGVMDEQAYEMIYQKHWDKALSASKAYNKQVIEDSTAQNWLPQYLYEDLSGGAAKYSAGMLLDCKNVLHSGEFSGLGTLSVLTVDLGANLTLGNGVGLFSQGETVYASRENLYVGMTKWHPQDWEQPAEEAASTFIHKFDIRDRASATYVASGEIRGWLLSQWAMSEHAGDLRVASTDQLGWDSATSENFVSVLRQEGDDLVQIGQVGGLGKTEQIHGVRFMGDVGYVVTFRQTDPLYTIDLKDPTNPVAAGELKIPGYSAYLHPIGEGLLLGVGRDGTEEGQLLGMQLSLFDVSDIKNPQQIQKASIGDDWGWSEALFDHKAFLWWGKSKLAMLPVEWSSVGENEWEWEYHYGAYGFTVDAEEGIQVVGEIKHPEPQAECDWETYYCGYTPAMRRSFVIGDLVYTLSDVGLKSSKLADLSDAAWVEFPQ